MCEDSVSDSDATLSDEEMADESSQSEQIGENEALTEENEALTEENEALSDENERVNDQNETYYLAGAFPVEKSALIPAF